ncbi:hypothetical protein [Sporolactobacillus shoreae]|uniref:hypothetical protein n=1 Tax=Sporolactobacillus shoreae TaxID=1465501 RepID=UPI0014330BD6|nr:hypothetical protein [Sporolactobacillus shoreae]
MRNGNALWSFIAGCGATLAFFWMRNNQNVMPKWAKQPMDRVNKTAQQVAGAFNPQG